MRYLAFRKEIIKDILADPKCQQELEKAKDLSEVMKVLLKHAKKRKVKVYEL